MPFALLSIKIRIYELYLLGARLIYRLVGEIIAKDANLVAIDVHDVAYEVNISLTTYSQIGDVGSKCTLYIYTAVREDDISLFGFSTLAEKKLFLHLISVNSIGAKVAIKILSGIGVEQLSNAILYSDSALLSTIPGIGKKKAERIILELKDKFDGVEVQTYNDERETVAQALINLGYTLQQARKAVEKLDISLSFQDMLKEALGSLSKV